MPELLSITKGVNELRFENFFSTVETHTCGDPTRTVIGGLPPIPGDTIEDKMLYLKEEKDWVRRTLMHQPRGNEVQAGAILTEPCSEEADIGVIYTEVGGYLYMCGHNTIGVATALVETGMVEAEEPFTQVNLETPAGVVEVKVKVEDGLAKEVSFTNVPSFVFAQDVKVNVPGYGDFAVDVAYGGLYYVMVDGEKLDFDPNSDNYDKIIRFAKEVRPRLNEEIDVYHPEKSFIDEVTHVLISAPPTRTDAEYKNAVVIPSNSVSRSPCGTGTAAKLALLHRKGKKGLGEEFVHEGAMTNTIFKAKAIKEAEVGDFPAIVPEITGSAYITGMNTYFTDPDDPLKNGFSLG